MRKYVYLAGAILGILLLYFIVILSKPVEIDIDEIEHFEGKRVIVHGIVIHKDILEDSEILLIENGTSTLHIFSTFSSHTHYGDEIEVVGKAEKYKGQWEVVADEIKIIKRWDVESIPLWELSEYAVEYDRKNVNVTGYVYKIFSTYLIITDEERNYEIKVLYPPDYNITVKRYDHVCVKAFFSYDATSFSFSLNIKDEGHGIRVLG